MTGCYPSTHHIKLFFLTSTLSLLELSYLFQNSLFLFCSATWPEGVRRLAKRYMTDPMQVYVGSLDLAACHSVTQRIEIVDEEYKRDRLVDFIMDEKDPNEKCIIFVGKKLV